MTDQRSIAFDATFTILYIGLSAGMFAISAALIALFAFHGELGQVQSTAAALNLAGWIALPFAPSLYRRATGRPFHWSSNETLGAAA